MPAPEIASRELVPLVLIARLDLTHEGIAALYEVIEAAEGIDETELPSESYVPGPEGSRLPVNASTSGAGTVFDAGKEGA